MRHSTAVVCALVLVLADAAAREQQPVGSRPVPPAISGIPPGEVARIVERFGADAPPELATKHGPDLEASWSGWTSARQQATRARLARGDLDSLVNLWLFGTSFTSQPPVRPVDIAASGPGVDARALIERRLEDLLAYLASDTAAPRAQFGREVLASHALDVRVHADRERARALLTAARRRVLEERDATDRVLAAARDRGGAESEARAHATIFRDRGLSSDTSLLPGFATDRALEALGRAGSLRPGEIQRAAIIGPGLDVINKSAGFDFYPPQTIQPFALIDALLRLGLASPGTLEVTTFDVNERVNGHLREAVARARDGRGYTVHLTLADTEAWSPELLRYWEGWGAQVGRAGVPAMPAAGSDVRVRAVHVSPSTVAMLRPMALNVVFERLDVPVAQRFDLIVATNVFVYYDAFEQALALANLAAMLRPGGSLLSNTPLDPGAWMDATVGQLEVVYSDRQFDRVFWYRRRLP